MSEKPKSRELADAMEGERRRLSGRLHDQVCQSLAGASLLLQGMEQAMQKVGAESPVLFAKLKGAVELALDQVRALAVNFEEAGRNESWLMDALARLCVIAPGARFVCERPVFVKDPDAALAIFRVAEEALDNALRHGRAREIVVELQGAGEQVFMEARDNGAGFQLAADYPASSGIGMMRTRAHAAGGRLTVETQPGRGTAVRVSVPAKGPGPPPAAGPDKSAGMA